MNANKPQEEVQQTDDFLEFIEILEQIEVNEEAIARNVSSVNTHDGSPLLF